MGHSNSTMREWLQMEIDFIQVTMMRQAPARLVLMAGLIVFLTCYMFYAAHSSGSVSEAERLELISTKLPTPPTSSELQRTNIFFLKTHKCGSSTVQNILMRFGLKNGLSFVLPTEGNYLGHPELFQSDIISKDYASVSGKYNIFTHHTRYNNQQVRSVMSEDVAFVTILRHPAELYESIYSFYNLETFYNSSFKELLRFSKKNLFKVRLLERIGLNQMSFDLGLSENDFASSETVENFIKKINLEFDLVMISEWMEASLVLLADLMKWPLDNIKSIKINARPSTKIYNMSAKQRQIVSEWNHVDYKLYSYFLSRFKQRILDYGEERMVQDIERLMFLNSKLYFRCVDSLNENGFSGTQSYQLRNEADRLCFYATRTELAFTQELRTIQSNNLKVINKLKYLLYNTSTEF